MQGCLTYVATGTAVFVGAPIFDVAAIWTTFAIGEYYGVSSGFLVVLGNPFIEVSGIEYFAVRFYNLSLSVYVCVSNSLSCLHHVCVYVCRLLPNSRRAWAGPATWGRAPPSWAGPPRSRWWRWATSTSTSGLWCVCVFKCVCVLNVCLCVCWCVCAHRIRS